MFPVECKDILPVHCLIIDSISIRGSLGHITVWMTKRDDEENIGNGGGGDGGEITLDPNDWEKIYDATHAPSWQRFVELKFDSRVELRPREIRGIYVHSTLPGDEAIVYDNQKSQYTHRDNFITVHPGYAHVCNKAFGATTLWGYGSPWRDRREFVGTIKYGVVYKLWHPEYFHEFGKKFQTMARSLFLCQRRLGESPFALLPDECIFYILNMCRWDWMNDSGKYEQYRRLRSQEDDSSCPISDDSIDYLQSSNTRRYIHAVRRSLRHIIDQRERFHHFHFHDDDDDDEDEEWDIDSDE